MKNKNNGMEGIWNKVYSEDSVFFGERPSELAKKCKDALSKKNIKKT